jgi:hypothetical protein
MLIACSAASMLAVLPLGTMADKPVDLAGLAANDDRVVLAALIDFVGAATGAGIAIGLYPVVRTYHRALALGSVVGRVIGAVLVLIGTLSLLVLLTVSQEAVAAGTTGSPAVQASAGLLVAVRDWVPNFLGLLPFGLGAAMYYWLMYVGRLVPRWLSGWGLVATVVALAATVYSGFTQDFGLSTVSTALNIPLGVQEMVLAGWLIVKGFDRRVLRSDADAAAGTVPAQAVPAVPARTAVPTA